MIKATLGLYTCKMAYCQEENSNSQRSVINTHTRNSSWKLLSVRQVQVRTEVRDDHTQTGLHSRFPHGDIGRENICSQKAKQGTKYYAFHVSLMMAGYTKKE